MTISTIDRDTERKQIERIHKGVIHNSYQGAINVLISPPFSPITLLALRKEAQYAGMKALYFAAGGEKWRHLL